MSAYEDTQEDYIAALYYDVQSTSALYKDGNTYASGQGTFAGNPTAAGTYLGNVNDGATGLFTEVTNHIVDFFYISSLGEYYDPYGFSYSVTDGQYDDGYWSSIYLYGVYIEEASVVVGETFASQDEQYANYQGPGIETLLYQAFIAPDWIQGPGLMSCPKDIYAGDNRGFSPLLESYRGFQAISAGVGGLQITVPPAFDTGYTYEFNQAVLQNNQIPPTAYNTDYLNECSSTTLNAYGHASTAGIVPPVATYSGSTSTYTTFTASISNPVPLFAFPIKWNAPVTLTEVNPTVLQVSGTLTATCYPSHELSVGGLDVATSTPTSDSFPHIAFCLGGGGQINLLISKNILLVPVP